MAVTMLVSTKKRRRKIQFISGRVHGTSERIQPESARVRRNAAINTTMTDSGRGFTDTATAAPTDNVSKSSQKKNRRGSCHTVCQMDWRGSFMPSLFFRFVRCADGAALALAGRPRM